MAYVINSYDGTVVTTVEDGTVDETLDLKLIGKNYAGYGEIQNENFVFLLENFARDIAPINAVRGQLWFDTVSKKIKVFTGDTVAGSKVWKTASGVDYTNIEPTTATSGDFWFDTNTSQLKVRTANSWTVVGPQAAGAGTTQMVSRQVKTSTGALKSIIVATINDVPVFITSKDDFTLDITDVGSNISGFNGSESKVIRAGINLPNTNSAGQSASQVFKGTATDALSLAGIAAVEYLKKSDTYNSTVPDGTPPLIITSKTLVQNLNADMVDGFHASSFIKIGDQYTSSVPDGTPPMIVTSKTKVTNLNADYVDGYDTSIPSVPNTLVVRDSAGNVFVSGVNVPTPTTIQPSWDSEVLFRNPAGTVGFMNQDALRSFSAGSPVVDGGEVSSVNIQAEAGKTYYMHAGNNVILPLLPGPGDEFTVYRHVNPCSIVRLSSSSNPIMGLSEDMVIDRQKISVTLRFIDFVLGWILV